MWMARAYYSKQLEYFLGDDDRRIFGELATNHQFELDELQKNSWIEQIKILKDQLSKFDSGQILFEYIIPRMGRRVDNIFLHKGIVFVLEFKIGAKVYDIAAQRQAEGYAVDLKNFQEGSRNSKIVPILVSTNAPNYLNKIEIYEDGVCKPLFANATNLNEIILNASKVFSESDIDATIWENSRYNPTPTIIEASLALYNTHTVQEITRKDAIGNTFDQTCNSIDKIILKSKTGHKKSIIFVTGVPGSGKTLVGLTIASKYQDIKNDERAVYISGTSTLISILQEALVRDKISRFPGLTKIQVQEKVEALFQYLLHFRREIIENPQLMPTEKIVVFDEAQRMWNQEQLDKEIKTKLRRSGTLKSEPDLLIGHINKFPDWAVIICLIGGGQEIHKGEYGTVEWLKSIKNNFRDWNVYIPSAITDKQYLGELQPQEILAGVNYEFIDELHLKTSTRSFRAENLSKLINHILDREIIESQKILKEIRAKYPLYVTRDLKMAKNWVKNKARGNDRFGLFTIAMSHRLRPEGIVKSGPKEFHTKGWWLDSEEYIDSSLALEIPCTEFFSQGLELDWAIFAWDACLTPRDTDWNYRKFVRKEWRTMHKNEEKRNLKNAFRVLLTRARQGMIIFVPKGDINDRTRKPEFYDGIFNYLKEIGIQEI